MAEFLNEDEKNKREEELRKFAEQQEGVQPNSVGPKITSVPGAKMPWLKERPIQNEIGWIQLPIEDLPTRGLFYPKDTTVAIRSASGAEIRHWSTLNEEDLSALDDMLNYIIERCVTIKSTDPNGGILSWKDVKEVDRFYLLLAVQELTFPEGENKLQVKISEKKRLDVKKDMVHYITLDPKLMQYYDEEERCFVLKIKGGKVLKLDLPTVGLTQWLKNYIIRKQRLQEYIDEDYLAYAPFVIRNWRGLNDDIYHSLVEESSKWDVAVISLMVYVKQLFADAVNPVIRFTDERGMEQTAPLNFQGGIKSIFLVSDPFGQLE